MQISSKLCTVEEVQHLLFDQPRIKNQGTVVVPDPFYNAGYFTVQNLGDDSSAQAYLDALVRSIDGQRAPLLATTLPRTVLAKKDAIPVCQDIVQTGFQALHYDMGMPFMASKPQPLYTISALYRPMDSAPNPLAKTRLVFLPKLLHQFKMGNRKQIEQQLLSYVRDHGDGWLKPKPHNTHRLAIFARVLDAVSGQNRLSDKIDTMIGQCFDYDHDPDGLNGLAQEQAFFSALGLDLAKAEEHLVLAPGEMLVFDNMRCVHGRIGRRRQRELINFLYGVKEASETEIENYRNWLYELLAD